MSKKSLVPRSCLSVGLEFLLGFIALTHHGAYAGWIRDIRAPVGARYGNFGQAGAGGADLTGDGVKDLIVTASGAIVLIDGKTLEPVWDLAHPGLTTEDSFFAGFGRSVDMMPDVDGDGVPEFLVSALRSPWCLDQLIAGEVTRRSAGAAFLFSGANRQVLSVVCSPNGNGQISLYADSVLSLKNLDFNGDGCKDFLVTAPLDNWNTVTRRQDNAGRYESGSVHFYSACRNGTGITVTRVHSIFGSQRGKQYGTAASMIDLDEDGTPEVAVTARGWNPDYDLKNPELNFYGPNGTLKRGYVHDVVGTGLGASIAEYDSDGDGRAESMLIGEDLWNPEERVGVNSDEFRTLDYPGMLRAQMKSLFRSGLQLEGSELFCKMGRDGARDGLGSKVAQLGDLDHDGYNEAGVTAQPLDRGIREYVLVVSGNMGGLVAKVQNPIYPTGDLYFGNLLYGPGDINDDGVDDLMIGNPGAPSGGVIRVYSGKAPLDLAVLPVGAADGSMQVQVSGARPGAWVYVMGSRDRGRKNLSTCGTNHLDLRTPQILGREVADSNGVAALSIRATVDAGRELFLQAISLEECKVSQRVKTKGIILPASSG